jgi:hypothetical protein
LDSQLCSDKPAFGWMAVPNIYKTMHDRAKIEKSDVVQQPARAFSI